MCLLTVWLADLALNVYLLLLNNGGFASYSNVLLLQSGAQYPVCTQGCRLATEHRKKNMAGNQTKSSKTSGVPNSRITSLCVCVYVWHLCASYLYLDLKKCSPRLSDLQPVLLWTCCPWKRDVMHLRLHRFIPRRSLPKRTRVPRLCTDSSVRCAQH